MRKAKPYILIGNVKEIVENKALRLKYTYRYDGLGDSYYIVDGKKMSESIFNARFPIDVKPIMNKGENSDRRKNWIYGGKSY